MSTKSPVKTSAPSTPQQLLRVIRHESPLFPLKLAKNTALWMFCKFLLQRRFITKKIHSYKMIFDLNDPGISRSLILVGDREREHRYMLDRSVQPGDTILDLGANIGYYVLMEHSLLRNQGHVIAVEPEPKNYQLLLRNIKLNNVQSLTTAVPAAVADQDGSAQLHLSRLGNVHSLIKSQIADYSGQAITINTVSLLTLIQNHPGIDIIRMDIEGYEYNVLRSLVQINETQRFTPKILFELHPPKYHHRNFNKLLADLYQLGYVARFLATSHDDLLRKIGLSVIAKIPTDGTVRYITSNIPLAALINLYPYSRAVLLQNKPKS